MPKLPSSDTLGAKNHISQTLSILSYIRVKHARGSFLRPQHNTREKRKNVEYMPERD